MLYITLINLPTAVKYPCQLRNSQTKLSFSRHDCVYNQGRNVLAMWCNKILLSTIHWRYQNLGAITRSHKICYHKTSWDLKIHMVGSLNVHISLNSDRYLSSCQSFLINNSNINSPLEISEPGPSSRTIWRAHCYPDCMHNHVQNMTTLFVSFSADRGIDRMVFIHIYATNLHIHQYSSTWI